MMEKLKVMTNLLTISKRFKLKNKMIQKL